jgi:hypothetical protein
MRGGIIPSPLFFWLEGALTSANVKTATRTHEAAAGGVVDTQPADGETRLIALHHSRAHVDRAELRFVGLSLEFEGSERDAVLTGWRYPWGMYDDPDRPPGTESEPAPQLNEENFATLRRRVRDLDSKLKELEKIIQRLVETMADMSARIGS